MSKDKKKKDEPKPEVKKPEDKAGSVVNITIERDFEVPRGPYRNWVARRRASIVQMLKEQQTNSPTDAKCWEVDVGDPETGWRAVFYIHRAELG